MKRSGIGRGRGRGRERERGRGRGRGGKRKRKRTSFGYHLEFIFGSFLRLSGEMESDEVWKAPGPF